LPGVEGGGQDTSEWKIGPWLGDLFIACSVLFTTLFRGLFIGPAAGGRRSSRSTSTMFRHRGGAAAEGGPGGWGDNVLDFGQLAGIAGDVLEANQDGPWD
jgi:hypothetical protein